MGADDGAGRGCVEHVWSMTDLHLSAERGAETGRVCTRCGAVAYTPDRHRAGRPPLPETRALPGE